MPTIKLFKRVNIFIDKKFIFDLMDIEQFNIIFKINEQKLYYYQ